MKKVYIIMLFTAIAALQLRAQDPTYVSKSFNIATNTNSFTSEKILRASAVAGGAFSAPISLPDYGNRKGYICTAKLGIDSAAAGSIWIVYLMRDSASLGARLPANGGTWNMEMLEVDKCIGYIQFYMARQGSGAGFSIVQNLNIQYESALKKGTLFPVVVSSGTNTVKTGAQVILELGCLPN